MDPIHPGLLVRQHKGADIKADLTTKRSILSGHAVDAVAVCVERKAELNPLAWLDSYLPLAKRTNDCKVSDMLQAHACV
jgi:hypothetical protein